MRHFDLPAAFPLEKGGRLQGVRVAYRTWGEPRPTATLVCHALTGSADVDDWWRGLFGPGKTLDPDRSYIVSANVLGGCYGTTGPTSTKPGRIATYGPDFPTVTIRDMVRLQAALLDHLGIERLDLAIGGSMGGMQVLEWALMYPDRVDGIVPIGIDATQAPWSLALSEAQRSAIVNDPKYRGGRYSPARPPNSGLATARMIAMCSYRSPQNFAERFPRNGDMSHFDIQSYLRHQGSKLGERFDANTYIALMSAMDTHDLGRGRGPIAGVLGRVNVPALVIAISSDVLYPASEVAGLAGLLGNADLAILDAPHGHDAFLIETDQLNDLIAGWLSNREVLHTAGSAP
ncbi:MAG: homoserine O-acetyltransferase [Actinomycetota bacterium]|nr:homoserine O-acetyltransferase [Actinomycetota bacterium]